MKKNLHFLTTITLLIFSLVNPSAVYGQHKTSWDTIEGCIGPYCVSSSNNPIDYLSRLEGIFSLVVSFMTILTGLFFIIHFVIGGFTWSTAGGDSQKVETAKTKMTNAAIGLIIVIASYSIIYIIGKVLGLDILQVGSLIKDYMAPPNLAI